MINDRDKTAARRRGAAAAALTCVSLALILVTACSRPPQRQFFVMNYEPPQIQNRVMQNPYTAVVRLREFSIEEAYNRPHLAYRLSRYEIRYYNFKSWAVRPTRMVTDLFFRHFNSTQLVSGIIRRFDEGRRPDYEISGFIEALEEYDSDDIRFARVAIRINMTRLSDGVMVYSRHFDLRRKVYVLETTHVVREMSNIVEYIFTEAVADIDAKLAAEFRVATFDDQEFIQIEEPAFSSEE